MFFIALTSYSNKALVNHGKYLNRKELIILSGESMNLNIRNKPEKLAMPILQNIDATEASSTVPQSTVVDHENIKILKHKLTLRAGNSRIPTHCVEIAIRNISDITISNVVFEVTFYDHQGDIIEMVNHNEIELKPNTSRAVVIKCPTHGVNLPKSYHVRITKLTEAYIEKVQLRQHQIRTNEVGEEEVTGMVKNISNSKTKAALVASFYNNNNEKIGTKVIFIKDIEPDNYKQFNFIFKPAKGDTVMTYNLYIVSDIEEC